MVGTENTIWDGEYHLPKKEFPEGNTNTVRQYIEPSLRAGIAYRSPSDTFRRRETLLVVPNFVERYQWWNGFLAQLLYQEIPWDEAKHLQESSIVRWGWWQQLSNGRRTKVNSSGKRVQWIDFEAHLFRNRFDRWISSSFSLSSIRVKYRGTGLCGWGGWSLAVTHFRGRGLKYAGFMLDLCIT